MGFQPDHKIAKLNVLALLNSSTFFWSSDTLINTYATKWFFIEVKFCRKKILNV